MTKSYQLSLYKYIETLEDPKSFKVTPLEAYYKNSLGNTVYVYYSPYLGILFKNLTTKITEKFSPTEGVLYLDAIEDYRGEMVLFYRTKVRAYILYYSDIEKKHLTYTLNSDCTQAFLVKFDSEIFCVYLSTSDNYIYYIKASDLFSSKLRLHDKAFNKQVISSVGYSTARNLPVVFLTVKDNTLLTHYEKFPSLLDKSFIEVFVDIKAFTKEIK